MSFLCFVFYQIKSVWLMMCICRSINNFLCLSFPMRNNPISVRTNLNQHNICVHPEGENNAYNIRLLISSIRIPSKNTHSVPTQYWFKLVLTQLRHFFQQTLPTYIFLTKKICWTLPKAMKSIMIFRREGKICVSLTLARRSVITPLGQQFHHQRGLRPWTRGFDFAPRKNIYSFW